MTSNTDGMKFKKVKETEAEKLLKKNYDATVAYLQAMRNKQERENYVKSRANRKVAEMRSTSSTGRSDKQKSGRSQAKGGFLDGLNINLDGNLQMNQNITVKNTNDLLEDEEDPLNTSMTDLMNKHLTKVDPSKKKTKTVVKRKTNEVNSLTEKIFNNDKIDLGKDQFAFKPLAMETVIEDQKEDGRPYKGPIGNESTTVRRAKQGKKRGLTTEENIAQ